MLAIAAVSGRGTVAMWGYPLWLFAGLWLVLAARRTLTFRHLSHVLTLWAIVFICLAFAFVVNYVALPNFDHRYRAVFFPGNDLAREISERYRNVTGRLPQYVIATMWDGGNVSHYTPSRPRVLINGDPSRAPWLDLADLRRQGAVIVWTWGPPDELPELYRKIAPDAAIQPPFYLRYHRGEMVAHVGWAILAAAPSPASMLKARP
jgi:hypothetical protein